MEQADALAARFPGSRTRPNSFGGVSMVFEHDGVWHEARLIERVSLEVFVRTLDVPGVRLTIEGREQGASLPNHFYVNRPRGPTDAEIATGIRDLEAQRSRANLNIKRSDDPIAALWIDAPAEQALVDAQFATLSDDTLGPSLVLESFRYLVEDGEVSIDRRVLDAEPLYRAFTAAAVVAARPHRLGRTWLDLAHGLGGTTTVDRWDLADRQGEFAVTIERAGAAVRIDNVRRLPGDDDDHPGLYTRARARRVAADGDRYALWRKSLDRAHRPKPGRGVHPAIVEGWEAFASDPVRLAARLRAHGALLDAAAPHALAIVDDMVELWWPGLELDPARLGPAVELLARLSVEIGAAVGPYR